MGSGDANAGCTGVDEDVFALLQVVDGDETLEG